MLTLYQAEWCPYWSAVRQRLTELGIDFIAKQVAPRQKDRKGEHEIPLLTNGTASGPREQTRSSNTSPRFRRESGSTNTARSTEPTEQTARERQPRAC